MAQDCSWLRVIHVYASEPEIPARLEEHVATLNQLYPKMKVDLGLPCLALPLSVLDDIDALCCVVLAVMVKGNFTSEMVHYLSQILGIRYNHMFIPSPSKIKLSQFPGIRVITH